MGELISSEVEFPVGERLPFEHHRHRLRRALDLLLEQLVDTFVPWIFPLRPVPLHQDLLPLGGREHRHFPHRAFRLRQHGRQQRLVVRLHPLDGRRVEQISIVRERSGP